MKRGKLILSLSLMCLAIAVLCFGVLAATSVTYTISGTISYEVSDVFVKINTRVFGVTAQQDKATVIANVKTLETKALNSIADSTYKLSQKMDEYDSTSADTGSATGIDLTYGGTKGYYTYYIVINIQNLSASKAVDAIITDNTTAELNSIKTTNLYQNNITSTETKNIVIAYSIKDKTSSIDSADINYSLKVSYEDTDYTNPITITNDTTNSYYYVSLGTGKSLDSSGNVTETDTDIKWKLVSLDGVSKYTYNSSDNFEARYLSDAVFLQETAVNSKIVFNTTNTDDYYDSTIRNGITGSQAALKDGSYFNITNSDVLSFIKEKNLGDIEYWQYHVDYTGSWRYFEKDSSKEAIKNEDNSKDRFWLMDMDEFEIFVGWELKEGTNYRGEDCKCMIVKEGWDNGSGKVFEYWLRSAGVGGGYGNSPMLVTSGGIYNFYAHVKQYYVRAAFQLA